MKWEGAFLVVLARNFGTESNSKLYQQDSRPAGLALNL